MRQGGEQASKQKNFSPYDEYLSFFWVIISMMYVVLFILDKCLLDSYQLFFIFTEVWLAQQPLCITVRPSDGMFLWRYCTFVPPPPPIVIDDSS